MYILIKFQTLVNHVILKLMHNYAVLIGSHSTDSLFYSYISWSKCFSIIIIIPGQSNDVEIGGNVSHVGSGEA